MRPGHIDKRPGMEDLPSGVTRKSKKSTFPSAHVADKLSADPRSSEFKARGKKSGIVEFKKIKKDKIKKDKNK